MEHGKVKVPVLNVNKHVKNLVCYSRGAECQFISLAPYRSTPTCFTSAKYI